MSTCVYFTFCLNFSLLLSIPEWNGGDACLWKVKLIMRRAVKRYTMLLEFLIALEFLPGCVWSVPTARVCNAPPSGASGAVLGGAHTQQLKLPKFSQSQGQTTSTKNCITGIRIEPAKNHCDQYASPAIRCQYCLLFHKMKFETICNHGNKKCDVKNAELKDFKCNHREIISR